MPRPDDQREAMLQAVLDNDVDAQRSLIAAANNPPPPPLPPEPEQFRSGPMNERVARLEVQMEQVSRSLGSIDAKLDKVNDRLVLLPAKTDLRSWQWQWVATGVGIIALTVGGITGGLALIAHFAG